MTTDENKNIPETIKNKTDQSLASSLKNSNSTVSAADSKPDLPPEKAPKPPLISEPLELADDFLTPIPPPPKINLQPPANQDPGQTQPLSIPSAQTRINPKLNFKPTPASPNATELLQLSPEQLQELRKKPSPSLLQTPDPEAIHLTEPAKGQTIIRPSTPPAPQKTVPANSASAQTPEPASTTKSSPAATMIMKTIPQPPSPQPNQPPGNTSKQTAAPAAAAKTQTNETLPTQSSNHYIPASEILKRTPESVLNSNPSAKPSIPIKNIPDLTESIYRKRIKKKSNPALVFSVLIVIAAIIIAIFFYLQHKQKKEHAQLNLIQKKSLEQELSSDDKIDIDKQKWPAKNNSKESSVFELANTDLLGESSAIIKTEDAIVSPALDAEIVAIAQALKIRAEFIHGFSISQKGTSQTRTVQGSFYNFAVKEVQSLTNNMVESSLLIITTPAKGIITIKDGFLKPLSNTSYESFSQELIQAGIQINKTQSTEKPENISVNLELVKFPRFDNPSFTIFQNGVGKIQLDMSGAEAEKILAENFTIDKKKILIDEDFFDFIKVSDNQGKFHLFIKILDQKIIEIQISNPNYKTERSISVNDTLGLFRVLYPDTRIGYHEENGLYAFTPQLNAMFMLQGPGYDIEKRLFPNTLSIRDILIKKL